MPPGLLKVISVNNCRGRTHLLFETEPGNCSPFCLLGQRESGAHLHRGATGFLYHLFFLKTPMVGAFGGVPLLKWICCHTAESTDESLGCEEKPRGRFGGKKQKKHNHSAYSKGKAVWACCEEGDTGRERANRGRRRGAPVRERAWECRSQKSQAWSGRAHPESCTSQRKATELRAFMSTKDGKQLRRAVSREVQSSAKGQTQCAEITQRLGGKDSNDSWFTW